MIRALIIPKISIIPPSVTPRSPGIPWVPLGSPGVPWGPLGFPLGSPGVPLGSHGIPLWFPGGPLRAPWVPPLGSPQVGNWARAPNDINCESWGDP